MTLTNELGLTSRQRLLSLAAVTATAFGVGLSFGIGFPLTALTFEAWSQPKWMIGLAGSVPAIAVLLVLPILPRVVTRLGPVTAIAFGCLVGAAGFMALYAFQSPWAWLVIRLLMSVGFALPWLAGETWINSVSKEATRGRVIAVYAIVFFSGFAIGPFVLQTLGLVGPWPFIVGTVGSAVASLPILLARQLAPEFCHDGSRDLASTFGLAPAAMAAAFIGGFAEISNLSLIPNVALSAGLSQDEALNLLSTMTAGGIMLQFPIGWLSDKVSRFALTIAVAVAFIALVMMMPVALTVPSAASVLAFLLGGVILGFYTLGLAVIGERIRPADLAAANAAFLVMYQAGSIIGPFAAGVAMTISPVIGFVAIMTGLMVICTIAVIVLEKRERCQAGRG
ncbi:major facilitator superfamily protein [Hyphomicrobium denitrificans 1NES1]|uniref:Major facilitator superfamily protein n=1 Tax=Hyphomicrobium denitrificans 1NES1 TaxID=670307 RepID=N0B8C9_9HYPH|nr:MFS transporter [Hyphomicrobium denitrificans]AGK58482.1 major facilitator superfamily protein [Hyphomicrobium denitrificans 1NES1]